MNNIFTLVRANVTAREAAERYGLQVSRNGMACCPFHDDRHPSMKVDERYYCFGCHVTGSAIDFTARLFGLTPLEAARKLADDFHLDPGGPGGSATASAAGPASAAGTAVKGPAALPRWKQEARARDKEGRCVGVLVRYERMLKARKEACAPASPDAEWDPRFADACRELTGIGHFIDLLYQPDAQARQDTADALIRSGAITRMEEELRCAEGRQAG